MKPQSRRILRHLEKKTSITPLEALGVYGVYRLAAVIYDRHQRQAVRPL